MPPSLFLSVGSPDTVLSDDEVRGHICRFIDALGPRGDVLILPPDFTRFHSNAGMITRVVSEHYNFVEGGSNPVTVSRAGASADAGTSSAAADDAPPTTSTSNPQIQILPALGTHAPMTKRQIEVMFGPELAAKEPDPFVVHDWRNDVATIGHAPASMVLEATRGMVDKPWPAQVNNLVWEKRKSRERRTDQGDDPTSPRPLVLSIGQVVPHEVTGMANFNKNLFVGTGGVDAINLSHFIGAVHGMENLMGRGKNPLRSILNYASETYVEPELDLWYVLTVMGTDETSGEVVMRGLYIGNNSECYDRACDLSLQVNFTLLERPPRKVVVYLNDEFRSTWLGNKAVYRTRMAVADGGEILILAPWVETFGEDGRIDELIREYGYVGTPKIMEAMAKSNELKENLSAVAHLIHGSSEGRFTITYCPGKLTREEVEGVGFRYGDLDENSSMYDVDTLRDGWNRRVVDETTGAEEEFYYISNPALGLWAVADRFEGDGEKNNTSDVSAVKPVDSSIPDQIASDMSGGVGGWKKHPSDV